MVGTKGGQLSGGEKQRIAIGIVNYICILYTELFKREIKIIL